MSGKNAGSTRRMALNVGEIWSCRLKFIVSDCISVPVCSCCLFSIASCLLNYLIYIEDRFYYIFAVCVCCFENPLYRCLFL